MFGSQTRPGAQVGSLPGAKDTGAGAQIENPSLKPTEPFWKSTESARLADASSPQHATEAQLFPRSSEADVRTLIIGPGVSVKGEITSCNRLVVEGKIEAKLADCPNVIIKEGGVFNGESTTDDADVHGCFEGNLVVQKRLLVRATGVSGTIAYGELEIERGGKISGEIKHEGNAAVAPLNRSQVG